MSKKTRIKQLEGRVIKKAIVWHGEGGGAGDPRQDSPSFSIETIDGYEFLFQIKRVDLVVEGVLSDVRKDVEILVERDFPDQSKEVGATEDLNV